MQLAPFTDFSAGYIQRKIDALPKQGSRKPWLLKQNYLFDLWNIRHGDIENDVLEFASPQTQQAGGSGVAFSA
jgi:monooxygenase